MRTPKSGGVKKGWTHVFVVVCDFKIFLYDCVVDKNNKPQEISPVVDQVLDMRDPVFDVNPVNDNDVIHAGRHDLPKIFRVATAQITHAVDKVSGC